VNYPSQDQIAVAAAVYLGGHIYDIDDAEAEALMAAGYIVDVTGNGYEGGYAGGY
jgi:hypothetical protein